MEKALVIGGGKVGSYVAKQLKQRNFDVKIIEQVDANAQTLEKELSGGHLIIGDACDVRTLEFSGCNQVNLLVVATGNDQTNLVVSLLAKTQFGVPKIISRINDPENTWLFNKNWGVDNSISMPAAMLSAIEEII